MNATALQRDEIAGRPCLGYGGIIPHPTIAPPLCGGRWRATFWLEASPGRYLPKYFECTSWQGIKEALDFYWDDPEGTLETLFAYTGPKALAKAPSGLTLEDLGL